MFCFISLNDSSNKLTMVLSKVFWKRPILHLGTVWAKGGENVSRKGTVNVGAYLLLSAVTTQSLDIVGKTSLQVSGHKELGWGRVPIPALNDRRGTVFHLDCSQVKLSKSTKYQNLIYYQRLIIQIIIYP